VKPSSLGPLLALVALATFGCSQEARERREVHANPEPALLVSDLPRSASTGAERQVRTVYVPAYSRVFLDRNHVVELAVTLSIRNTDDRNSIELTAVRYYASDGELVEEYLAEGAVELAPMSTGTQPLATADRRGGEGANFIVEWTSAVPVIDPIIEAVMVSGGMQGISFVSRGSELRRP